MTGVGDECLTFDLGIPEVVEASQGSWLGGENDTVAIDVEGMPILVQVCLG